MSREEGRVVQTVPGRRIIATKDVPYREYDMEGPLQRDISYLPLSYRNETREGCYLMRMDPGAVTVAHDHPGFEEFMVLEGELIDSDGRRLRAGDFVSYDPGTHHNSWTESGCVLVVFEWGAGTPRAGKTETTPALNP
jgi:quercetin dioxygenase-like cupin family protein